MCNDLNLRTTGDKRAFYLRLAAHYADSKSDPDRVKRRIEASIGDVSDDSGLAARVRRFYTDRYFALDRFDRHFYELARLSHARDWKSYYCWCLIYCAVINARAVWCSISGSRVSMMEFLKLVIEEENGPDVWSEE